MSKLSAKNWIIFVACVVALVSVRVAIKKKTKVIEQSQERQEFVVAGRQPWMTIFVHGSFGSLLSFLSASNVLSDKVEGTSYKKVVGRMRKDSFFYREQPLLGKGLIKISPSFDLSVTGSKKFAAYPLLKAYEEVNEYAKPDKEENFFYTFGWSGLLSQHRRCLEAIRFYNMVSEELEEYHKNGVYPKVRVLTHSHGGNVIGYVGAVYSALQSRWARGKEIESVTRVRGRFKALPCKSKAKKKKGQKKWDYRPTYKKLAIDETILWGMPVQPETDHLFLSPVFKQVYHFYSDEDLVQRVDFVSTNKGYSDRRFDSGRLCRVADAEWFKAKNRLVQSRIMVSRDITRNSVVFDDAKQQETADAEKKQESFWSVLFSGGSFITPSSEDPTHKELWFFSWKDEKSDVREFVLAPFPAAIFSPLFVLLIGQKPELNDVDINITKSGDKIEFGLV